MSPFSSSQTTICLALPPGKFSLLLDCSHWAVSGTGLLSLPNWANRKSPWGTVLTILLRLQYPPWLFSSSTKFVMLSHKENITKQINNLSGKNYSSPSNCGWWFSYPLRGGIFKSIQHWPNPNSVKISVSFTIGFNVSKVRLMLAVLVPP